jgi:hypothetical protein
MRRRKRPSVDGPGLRDAMATVPPHATGLYDRRDDDVNPMRWTFRSRTRRKLGRLPACYFVCERNSVVRIRTQVGMKLEILERLCRSTAPGKRVAKTSLGTTASCDCHQRVLRGAPPQARLTCQLKQAVRAARSYRFNVSTISWKLMKSPTSGRYSPLPASSGCANAPATMSTISPSSLMSPI